MCSLVNSFVFRIHCAKNSKHQTLYAFACDFSDDDMGRLMLDDSGRILVCTDMGHLDKLLLLCDPKFREASEQFIHEEEILDVYVRVALGHLLTEDDDPEDRLYDLICIIDDALCNLGCDHKGRSYDDSPFLQGALRDAGFYVRGRRKTISGFFGSGDTKKEFLSELNASIKFIESKLHVVS